MKLEKIITITGKIKILTGLHIGAGKDSIEIGGLDSPVIKTKDGKPYIPGSSLKGKLRCLLEWKLKEFEDDGKISNNSKNKITHKIFGTSDKKSELGPTRLIVRDCYLDETSKSLDQLTEIKYENTINRLTAVANPRQIERVVEGVVFDLDMSFRVFEKDNLQENLNYLYQAMKLLELDALGGGGSRGNGKIKFEDLKIIDGNKEESIDLSQVSLDDPKPSNQTE